MVAAVSGMIFLSTPHRGTDLAEILNRLMRISFHSSKEYILDLKHSSLALEEINEQFRHVAPKLSVFSFHETLPTSMGPKKIVSARNDSPHSC